MATTKTPTKGIKNTSSRTVKADSVAPTSPAGGGKLRLKSSHGGAKPAASSKTGSKLKASPAPLPPPTRAPSIPPRARKAAKAAAEPSATSSEAGKLAVAIAAAAIDKKASNVEIIDLGGKADYADYLVVMTGGSDRHVRALADAIQQSLDPKMQPLSVEGVQGGSWVLIDFGDVVAHVFQDSVRALYDIEGLWLDAARVPVPEQ